MPEDGGGGDARGLAPALLEAELTAEFDEAVGAALEEELLDADEVVVVLDLVLDFLSDLLNAGDEGAEAVEDAEFPFGGEVVRGLEEALLEGRVGAVGEVVAEALGEAASDGCEDGLQALEDPGVELASLLGHHLVEDGRLDVGEDDAVKHLEDAALDERPPVEESGVDVLLEAGQDVGEDHLVGLLVQLGEVHGVDLVVPAADAGRVVDHLQQVRAQ